MDELITWLSSFITRENNPLGMLMLGGASLLEYLFPPFPGDTITLLGAVVISAYGWSFWGIYGAVMAGAMLGSMIAFYFGARIQSRRELKGRKPQRGRVDFIVYQFHRHGPYWLMFNRFMPSFRAVFFIAAGMARMKWWKVLIYSTISAALWNLLIIGAGSLIGARLDELQGWLSNYTKVAWGVVGLVVVVGGGLYVRQRRKPRDDEGDDRS